MYIHYAGTKINIEKLVIIFHKEVKQSVEESLMIPYLLIGENFNICSIFDAIISKTW